MWEQRNALPSNVKQSLNEIAHICSTSSINDDDQHHVDRDNDELAGITDTESFIAYYQATFGKTQLPSAENCAVETAYVRKVQHLAHNAKTIVHGVDDVLRRLSSLEITNIETSTTLQDLHFNCENLNSEYRRLSQIADRIQEPLLYFDDIVHISSTIEGQILSERHRSSSFDADSICKLMHSTGVRIRECVQFLEANDSFVDAPEYLAKYRAVEAKLAGAMKSKICHIFDSAFQKVRNELLKATSPSDDRRSSGPLPGLDFSSDAATLTTFFYIRFASYSAAARRIIKNLEDGVASKAGTNDRTRLKLKGGEEKTKTPDHIQHSPSVGGGDMVHADNLAEVHEHYCTLRFRLLSGPFKDKIAAILVPRERHQLTDGQQDNSVAKPDLLNMAGSSLLEMEDLFEREIGLFYQHFCSASTDAIVLARRLRQISSGVRVDDVAGNPISMQSVDKHTSLWNMLLAIGDTLYSVLRAEIIKEGDIFRLCSLIDMLTATKAGSAGQHLLSQPCVAEVRSKLLRDCHERLAYRSEIFIKQRMQNFKLDEAGSRHSKYLESLSSSADKEQQPRQLFHPLLQDLQHFLERLSPCLEPPVFQTLSQEAVKACCLSLLDAAEAVDATYRLSNPLRAPLFALSHFMALRELIAKFDVRCTIRSRKLNFSQTKSAFTQLLGAGTSLFRWGSGNAFVKLIKGGMPTVSEEDENIRDELESHLLTARQQYISRGTDRVLRGLRANDAGAANELDTAVVTALEETVPSDLEVVRAEVETHFSDGSAREVVLNPLIHALVRQVTTLRDECLASQKVEVARALDGLMAVVKACQ